jgi:hypothetical protein
MTFTIGRRGLLTVGVIAVLAIGAGVGYASIPDSVGVIHGCYDNKGTLRVIDTQAGGACKNNETPISWSQSGPQGPPGENGTNGTNGVSGYEQVAGSDVTLNQTIGEQSSVVFCPAGKKVIGGGYLVDGSGSGGDSSPFAITENGPQTTSGKDGPPLDLWTVTAEVTETQPDPANYTFRAVAICANAA